VKILVVGAGATGGYYGGRLAQAGRDVTFLVRERRAAQLRERGLRITGLGEDETVEPTLVTAGEIDGLYDLVILTVKATGLDAALDDLAPAVGPGTVLLPVLNGMAHLDALDARFPDAQVLGGVVRILATLTDDGDVQIMAPLAQVRTGPRSDRSTPSVDTVLETLDVPGVEVQRVPDVVATMWHKWVFIVAAGAVTGLARGPVGPIVDSPGGSDFVRDVLAEVTAVAEAAGYPVPERETATSLAMLTEPGSTFTSSLYRDLVAGRATEAEHLLGDLTRRARDLGVPTPLVDLALLQMRVAEKQRA
jgi:2-dehydropantoate 2-reductase